MRSSSFYIAQVQDEFYGNVGTYREEQRSRECNLWNTQCRALLITKIESCRYEILTYTSSIRKIGGSNPPLGTKVLE